MFRHIYVSGSITYTRAVEAALGFVVDRLLDTTAPEVLVPYPPGFIASLLAQAMFECTEPQPRGDGLRLAVLPTPMPMTETQRALLRFLQAHGVQVVLRVTMSGHGACVACPVRAAVTGDGTFALGRVWPDASPSACLLACDPGGLVKHG